MALTPTLIELGTRLACLEEEDRASYHAHGGRYSRPFVITRRKDDARYQRASELLVSLGHDPIRFSAVEGTKIENEDLFRLGYPLLRPGEKGCLASHLCVLALAATHAEEDQYTLVFEDDIVSPLTGTGLDDNLARLSAIVDRISPDGDKVGIVHLGKCLENCSTMEPVEGNVYYSVQPSCTHALAIRNGFARRLMAELKDYNIAIDGVLGDYVRHKRVRALVFHPSLFFQDVIQAESGLRGKKEQMTNYLECRDSCSAHPSCPSSSRDSGTEERKAAPATTGTSKDAPTANGLVMSIVVAVVVAVAVMIVLYAGLRSRRYGIAVSLIVAVTLGVVVALGILGGSAWRPGSTGAQKEHTPDVGSDDLIASKPPPIGPVVDEEVVETVRLDGSSILKGYKAFNPNMVSYRGHVYTAVRASNGRRSYTVVRITTLDGAPVSETRVDVDIKSGGYGDGEDERRTERAARMKKEGNRSPTGLEDMRLFVFQDGLWLVGVNLDGNYGHPRMCLMDLSAYLDRREERIVPLVYAPVKDKPNKNWAPLVIQQPYGEVLLLIVDVDPLLIVKPDLESGRCHLVHAAPARSHPKLFAPARNSTVTARLPDGTQGGVRSRLGRFLMLVHSKYVASDFVPSVPTVYYQHRFAVVDVDTMTTTLSEPFNVEKAGFPHIEYVSGLLVDARRRQVVIGYGIQDKEARSVRLSYEKVNRLLGSAVLV
jgi:GR25 family glycosyltransferase involved in LPS biosynthesis